MNTEDASSLPLSGECHFGGQNKESQVVAATIMKRVVDEITDNPESLKLLEWSRATNGDYIFSITYNDQKN